jgi:hypothetical protein
MALTAGNFVVRLPGYLCKVPSWTIVVSPRRLRKHGDSNLQGFATVKKRFNKVHKMADRQEEGKGTYFTVRVQFFLAVKVMELPATMLVIDWLVSSLR